MGKAEMWGRAMGGAPRLLPLLLLLPGAVGLECLSCGAEDGTCRGATNVTCPPESDVCAEAWAAVVWSHGRWALGARGCGRGQAGGTARALELGGLVLFARRRQCGGGGACNGLLPLGPGAALPLPGNASARAPNGVLCYGCPDDGPCPPTTVVQCYDDLRGCFHGNVTLTLGGVTLWREVRGCVKDQSCTQESRGDETVGLRGSCCAGDLCNRDLTNKSLFSPDLPRLELLPHGHAPTATPNATKMAANATEMAANATEMAAGATKMAAGATKMAAGATKANRGGKGVNGTARAATTAAKMAAAHTNMAATRANMAAGGGGAKVTARANGSLDLADANMAAVNPNMAAHDPNMAAVDPNMAAVNPNMAAHDPNMAAVDPNMAAHDPNMAAHDPNMAAGDPNMAAGDPDVASGAGRPLGRKTGVKGPVGRGHARARPGWLLPLLLLPLL